MQSPHIHPLTIWFERKHVSSSIKNWWEQSPACSVLLEASWGGHMEKRIYLWQPASLRNNCRPEGTRHPDSVRGRASPHDWLQPFLLWVPTLLKDFRKRTFLSNCLSIMPHHTHGYSFPWVNFQRGWSFNQRRHCGVSSVAVVVYMRGAEEEGVMEGIAQYPSILPTALLSTTSLIGSRLGHKGRKTLRCMELNVIRFWTQVILLWSPGDKVQHRAGQKAFLISSLRSPAPWHPPIMVQLSLPKGSWGHSQTNAVPRKSFLSKNTARLVKHLAKNLTDWILSECIPEWAYIHD